MNVDFVRDVSRINFTDFISYPANSRFDKQQELFDVQKNYIKL